MKVVVFVDVQKDFIDGALRNEKAIEVTPKIVEFAKECVANGYKLYATRDTHEKTEYRNDRNALLSLFHDPAEADKVVPKDNCAIAGYYTTLEGKKLPVEHCIEGTDGWMIDEQLWNVIEGKVTVVNKPTFGSFDLTEIINEDETKRIAESWDEKKDCDKLDEIILCGFCTSICVLANAVILRAKFPNTKITVMKELCACITEESHSAALKCLEMQQIEIG